MYWSWSSRSSISAIAALARRGTDGALSCLPQPLGAAARATSAMRWMLLAMSFWKITITKPVA